MKNHSNEEDIAFNQPQKSKKGILKGIGSILIAIVASSHHWVHTLLIALGLTSLGTGLLSISPWIKLVVMIISLLISFLMIRVAVRKWHHHRSISWVYLISSIISIIIVASALPQVVMDNISSHQKNQQESHQQHHMNE